ncbi:MAG: hypothetical protein ACREQW_11295 [Candidatus Binatia bacterium]
MENTRRNSLLALLAFFFLSACAAKRPVLYPDDHLKRVGSATADQDVNICMRQAGDYLARNRHASEVAGSAAVGAGGGAAVGAAGGAAGGAVLGHAGRGAAVGAAGGAAAGMTRGLLRGLFRSRQPDPVYQKFVNRCLREKGYDLIGWE